MKSFWHDISLKSNHYFNMIIEIPASSKTIMEMSTKEEFNPIIIKPPKQISNNTEFPIRIRDYSKDPICNYGFFPMTYSSKNKIYHKLYCGDGDPLDVIEMGGPTNYKPGDIIQVKLLGSFCLIDQNEVDWKIVVSNKEAESEVSMEKINKTMRWFKIFKTFFGKKENTILDNDKFFSISDTLDVIEECHSDYMDLIKKRNNF